MGYYQEEESDVLECGAKYQDSVVVAAVIIVRDVVVTSASTIVDVAIIVVVDMFLSTAKYLEGLWLNVVET